MPSPVAPPVSEAHLRSLQTAVTELSRPVPLEQVAAIVADAAIDALDPQAVVIAIHEHDDLHLRGVHVAGLPEQAPAAPLHTTDRRPAPLVGEIEHSLRSAGAGPRPATLAAVPIAQGERTLGLLVIGRPITTTRSPTTIAGS